MTLVINMNVGEKPVIPLGLGYALAENTSALRYFSELPEEKQREYIEKSRSLTSRAQMRQFVRNITNYPYSIY